MNPQWSLYTHDKTSDRSFKWLWFLRLAQILISFIVLAITGALIAGLAGSDSFNCSVPGKMGWNLACAILALLALAYLVLSSGTAKITRILPWWIFIQLGLDFLFFIFWISAAGTSHFSCEDLCSTCDAWGSIITYDRLDCSCSSSSYLYWKRDMSANPNHGLFPRKTKKHSSKKSGGSGGLLIAREALDAIMTVLFFITLCSTAWWMWQTRKGDSTAAPATNPNPEHGAVQEVTTEVKQDTPYTGAPQNNTQPQQPYYPPQQQEQQQPYYPPQQQQQPYQQSQSPPAGYYGGPGEQQQQPYYPPQQQQQPQVHEPIPNYPTPTPEMQAEHGNKAQ